MSVAFTTPSGEVLQSLAFYNELQLALRERCISSGIAPPPLFSDGDYWQKFSMYQTWQSWLEGDCIKFIDHVSGPLNPAKDGFLYFTLATWRSAAGLNAGGFSRYDKDGNFIGYGIAQDDDLICDKLFLELQAGFSALKWTLVGAASSNTNSLARWGITDEKESCGEAVSIALADFNANTWVGSSYTYHAAAYLVASGGLTRWDADGWRASSKVVSVSISTFKPHTADLYIKFAKFRAISGSVFEDIDGWGVSENQYAFFQTFAENTVNSRTSDQIGQIDVSPLSLTSVAVCPSGGDAGEQLAGANFVIKWNFANA